VVSKRRAGNPQVHSITSTRAPLGDDIARRARRYALQMGLRTVCFLSAVFTWGRIPTPISVALLVGAIVLPYVAVVLANAGRERPEQADPFLEITRQLGSGPTTPPATDRSPRDDGHAQWDQDGDSGRWQHDDRSRRDGTPTDGPHRG
jgi:hypothetical protein